MRRLSAAVISTRLSQIALATLGIAAFCSVATSRGDDAVQLAQATSVQQSSPALKSPPRSKTVAKKPEPAPPPVPVPQAQAQAQPQAQPNPAATVQPLEPPHGQPSQQTPPSFPAALPDPKQPPPDVWSEQEIADAKAMCTQMLQKVEAVYNFVDPIKAGECGAPAPVELVSVGSNPKVTLNPPAILTCTMVANVAEWMKMDVQPAAKVYLGEPVTRLQTMSSYSCRNAYNRKRTRLSEHGRANALDIGRFITTKGEEAILLAHWGMTARDVRAAIAAAKAAEEKRLADEKRAAEAKKLAEDKAKGRPGDTTAKASDGVPAIAHTPPPIAQTPSTVRSVEIRTPLPGRLGFRSGTLIEGVPVTTPVRRAPETSPASLTQPNRLGRGQAAKESAPGVSQKAGPQAEFDWKEERKSRFLREIHVSACKRFGTVLGPEANDAHRDHFHLDMAERRSGNFCE
jgi:hypothetical protein